MRKSNGYEEGIKIRNSIGEECSNHGILHFVQNDMHFKFSVILRRSRRIPWIEHEASIYGILRHFAPQDDSKILGVGRRQMENTCHSEQREESRE